jgi:hypothetical protein
MTYISRLEALCPRLPSPTLLSNTRFTYYYLDRQGSAKKKKKQKLSANPGLDSYNRSVKAARVYACQDFALVS